MPPRSRRWPARPLKKPMNFTRRARGRSRECAHVARVVDRQAPLRDHERLVRVRIVELGRPGERVRAEVVVVVAVGVEICVAREVVAEAVAANGRNADRQRVPNDRQMGVRVLRNVGGHAGHSERTQLRAHRGRRASVHDDVDSLEGAPVRLGRVGGASVASAIHVQGVVHLAERSQQYRLSGLGNRKGEANQVRVALAEGDRLRADRSATTLGFQVEVRPVTEQVEVIAVLLSPGATLVRSRETRSSNRCAGP